MKNRLSSQEKQELFAQLLRRWELRPRPTELDWNSLASRLEAHPDKLYSLSLMEESEGEPDFVWYHERSDECFYADCSPESPKGRRSLCYDRQAWESRKQARPACSALEMAESMGVTLLTEEDYFKLQSSRELDLKSSSWLWTPPEIRGLGGSLFGDRRFGRVFIYHNGAESYFSARGFRGLLKV